MRNINNGIFFLCRAGFSLHFHARALSSLPPLNFHHSEKKNSTIICIFSISIKHREKVEKKKFCTLLRFYSFRIVCYFAFASAAASVLFWHRRLFVCLFVLAFGWDSLLAQTVNIPVTVSDLPYTLDG